jgi:hypothetical protein
VRTFKTINKRLAKLGSAVTVLAEAGQDKNRNRQVSISCALCGVGTEWRPEVKTVRLSDLTRKVAKNKKTGKRTGPVKSCGCLKKESYARYRLSRKRSGPLVAVVPKTFWERFDNETGIPPVAMYARSLYRFYPSAPSGKRGKSVSALHPVPPINFAATVAAAWGQSFGEEQLSKEAASRINHASEKLGNLRRTRLARAASDIAIAA